MNIVTESYAYKQLSASANVSAVSAALGGIFVSSTSGATITVYDDSATGTSTKLVDTFTPLAASFYPLPFSASKGLYIVISGTASITVGYKQ